MKQIQKHQIDYISCTTSTEIFSTSWMNFVDVLYYHQRMLWVTLSICVSIYTQCYKTLYVYFFMKCSCSNNDIVYMLWTYTDWFCSLFYKIKILWRFVKKIPLDDHLSVGQELRLKYHVQGIWFNGRKHNNQLMGWKLHENCVFPFKRQ